MSFTEVLSRLGQSITINTVTRENSLNDGYLRESVSQTSTTAIIQPLRSEELVYLAQSGHTEKDLKMYMSPSESVQIGDEIEWDGERYLVKNIEKNSTYLKVLLQRRESAS